MSCLRLHSRSGVPTAPRKYLVVTMFAALTLHDSGNSTPRCSKLIEPSRQLVMTTSRRSQDTSSYGWTPSVVHTRAIFKPWATADLPPFCRGAPFPPRPLPVDVRTDSDIPSPTIVDPGTA